jgi:hypothetical protein
MKTYLQREKLLEMKAYLQEKLLEMIEIEII